MRSRTICTLIAGIPGILLGFALPARAGIVPQQPLGTGATTLTFVSDLVPVPILDLQPNRSTIDVSGMNPYVWDVNLVLWAEHAVVGQLDIRLTSPSGTVAVISTDSAYERVDMFFPLRLDDQANYALRDFDPDYAFELPPMTPEGALSCFLGEDPNGTWTLECADDEVGVQGSFVWEMEITSLHNVPLPTVRSFPLLDPQPIPPGETLSTITVPSIPLDSIIDLQVRVSLEHPNPSDLKLILKHDGVSMQLVLKVPSSPDSFMGTWFDDDAAVTVADAVGSPIDRVTPDGALGYFNGRDASGDWTLRVIDFSSGDPGMFYGWELVVTIARGIPPTQEFCGGEAPVPCPCGNNGVPDHGCASAFNPNGMQLEMLLPNGIARLGDDDVELFASELEPFQICLFLQSRSTVAGAPFGDGLLCLSGELRRLAVKSTGFGFTSYPGLFDRPLWQRSGVAPPGETRAYQVVSRSSLLFGPCQTGLNATNGVRALWVP